MLINKKWIFIAGLFGFTGVALDAFGTHIISDKIPENLYETYKTGVLYYLIHSVVGVPFLTWLDFTYMESCFKKIIIT